VRAPTAATPRAAALQPAPEQRCRGGLTTARAHGWFCDVIQEGIRCDLIDRLGMDYRRIREDAAKLIVGVHGGECHRTDQDKQDGRALWFSAPPEDLGELRLGGGLGEMDSRVPMVENKSPPTPYALFRRVSSVPRRNLGHQSGPVCDSTADWGVVSEPVEESRRSDAETPLREVNPHHGDASATAGISLGCGATKEVGG
jgi:hypothetical protein